MDTGLTQVVSFSLGLTVDNFHVVDLQYIHYDIGSKAVLGIINFYYAWVILVIRGQEK